MKTFRRLIKIVLIGVPLLVAVFFLFLNLPGVKMETVSEFGVTFTPTYAESLGVDWREAYRATLDDLGVRLFRLSAQWKSIEPADNIYAFEDLDFQMDEAAARGARVLLGVGRKLPRWPECHDPEWVTELSQAELREKVLKNVRVVVDRYKNHPALDRWQVENEVFFPFGICPYGFDLELLKQEVELVRSLDQKHKTVVTDSGEWTLWMPIGFVGDVLGISMYREAWNDFFNIHVPFPINEGWYQLRARLISPWKKNIIVTELQAEPWAGMPVAQMTPEEAQKWMPLEKIQDNIQFAKN
ncbi:MAG: hypothetical protein AAB855_04625, partial [Patescibacteria group bacterium]